MAGDHQAQFAAHLSALVQARAAESNRCLDLGCDAGELGDGLTGRYGLVIGLQYILNHVDGDALSRTFARLARHTEPDALLFFHLRSLGNLEATDGEIAVERERGGYIIRRHLRIDDGEYLLFHSGYYKDSTGALGEIDQRRRLYGHAVADLRARLAEHGFAHAATLDVGGNDLAVTLPGGSFAVEQLPIERADDAAELLLLASASSDALARFAARLTER